MKDEKYDNFSIYIEIQRVENEIEINIVAYHTDLHFHQLKCKENIEISKIISFIRRAFKLFEFQNDYFIT